jgi:hypothetical protein
MKAKKKPHRLPVCKAMCGTCPFRDGSPYADLAPALTLSAMTEAARICHSTGTNAIGGRTGKPSTICRGARDIQLRQFHAMDYIEAATDEAWDKKHLEVFGPPATGSG